VETRFGINAGGLRRDKQELPADGPARVVKPGDWGAVADAGMKGFPMTAFSMPGRAQPKPNPAEVKIAELAKEARKADEAHKQALQKALGDGEAAAKAAMARGREEGMREGENRAWAKYQKELETLRSNASVALDVLQQEKAMVFLEFEGQVLELLSASIHRVFDGVAKEHSEAVLPLLKKAVTALGQVSNMTLKVNPADFRTSQDNQDFWLPVDAALKDIRIVSDERIPKGGCFVESDSTSVGLQADELADRIDDELKRIFTAKAQALKGPEELSIPGTAEPGEAGDDAGDDVP
jgi:flagellar assembly protein FliH